MVVGDGRQSGLFQIVAILACSFASLSNGLLISWTSPSIPRLVYDDSSGITLEQASYFTVISPIAMISAAPLVTLVLEHWGRRAGILLIAVPQLLSWVFILVANNNIWIYYLSRVMVGAGDAAYFGTVPVYVSEVTEPAVRGVWGNAPTLIAYLGTFLINLIGVHCDIRTTALIFVGAPILHVVLFWSMPESPHYLMEKNRLEEAEQALRSLRRRNDVQKELMALRLSIQSRGTLKDLFEIRTNRRALLICVMIRVAQQLSGLSAFESYALYLFQQADGAVSAETSSIIFFGIMLVCVALSVYTVELIGRRPLMIISCTGCGVALTIITAYFFANRYAALDTSGFGWVPLAGMVAYLVAFSPGLGTVPTLILGELFSISIKGKAMSVMNVVLGVSLLVVPKLFETLGSCFGVAVPFLVFAISCFVFAVLSYLYAIETKGKTLEEIQRELEGVSVNHNAF